MPLLLFAEDLVGCLAFLSEGELETVDFLEGGNRGRSPDLCFLLLVGSFGDASPDMNELRKGWFLSGLGSDFRIDVNSINRCRSCDSCIQV